MGVLQKVFLTLIFTFLLLSFVRNIFEYKKNYSFYEEFRSEFQNEKKKNTSLKTQILKKSDPGEVEKIIRNKLNLLRPNEVAIILPNPTPTPVVVIPTPPPPLKQWIAIFFQN